MLDRYTESSRAQDRTTLALCKALNEFVSRPENSTFTCGGSISLSDVAYRLTGTRSTKSSSTSSSSSSAGPIVVHWNRPDGTIGNVEIPPKDGDTTAIDALVDDCAPAYFGHKGKDVYDEKVRKAKAMDKTSFTTNICPYVLGIVDRITQILLPSVDGMGLDGAGNGKIIRAELYKLNVSLSIHSHHVQA